MRTLICIVGAALAAATLGLGAYVIGTRPARQPHQHEWQVNGSYRPAQNTLLGDGDNAPDLTVLAGAGKLRLTPAGGGPNEPAAADKAAEKDPRVCTHCICGCTETGHCDCKDCDHPKLAPAAGGHKAMGGKNTGLSYAEARRKAVEQDKPICVWVGGFSCPYCEEELTDYIHVHTDSLPGCPAECCVIGKPDGAGDLTKCGVITGACSASKIKAVREGRRSSYGTGGACPGGTCATAGDCGVAGCRGGGACASCGGGGYGGPVFFGGPSFGGGCPGGNCGGPPFGGGCAGGNCGGGGCSSCGGRRR